MSDVDPFLERAEFLPANPDQGSDPETFSAPLDGFDWVAYADRQERLNQVLHEGDPEALAQLIHVLQAQDPDVGVKLNNLHHTTLTGELPGLIAPLAVMSMTNVQADMPGLDFEGGVAPRARFTDRDLRGANFMNSVLPQADFKGAKLRGADFTNVVLNGADFTGADLVGVDFSGAYMIGVKGLEDPETIQRVDLSGVRTVVADGMKDGSLESFLASYFGDASDIETIKRKLDPVPVARNQTVPLLQTKRNLRGLVANGLRMNDVDFSRSYLIGAHLEDIAGTGAQFRNAKLSGAVVMNAILRNADLFNAWAPGAIFQEVNLRGANITNANLVGSVFQGVDLREVMGLDAKDTNLEGIVIEDCRLPKGFGYDGVALQKSQKLQRELEG